MQLPLCIKVQMRLSIFNPVKTKDKKRDPKLAAGKLNFDLTKYYYTESV